MFHRPLPRIYRSSHRRCSVRKGVFSNFAKSTGRQLCQSLFFNKVTGLSPATLLKNRLRHRCFPVNFTKFLRIPFLQNTSGRLLLDSQNLITTFSSNFRIIFYIKSCWSRTLTLQKRNCFICFNESPLKMVKNASYFILKALFVLNIFKFLSWLFGHVEKTAWLEI